MPQGGLRRLSLFKFLKVEDLTEKERSIISPKVIPLVQARYLILEAVPKIWGEYSVPEIEHGKCYSLELISLISLM